MIKAIDWHRAEQTPCETCGARCPSGTPHRALTVEESDASASVMGGGPGICAGYVVGYGMTDGPIGGASKSKSLSACLVFADALYEGDATICVSAAGEDGYQAYVERYGDNDDERETSYRGAGTSAEAAVASLYDRLVKDALDLAERIAEAVSSSEPA
jgi:hypothetical protein